MRHGRIVTAQATTTEHCSINRDQQLRWHYLIEAEWENLRNINLPTPLFNSLHAHFQINIDETCFMCSEGNLKIVGDAKRRRHDKSISDNCISITVLRCGCASGTHGPVIFIMKGIEVNRMFSRKQLEDVWAYLGDQLSFQTKTPTWMTPPGPNL